MVMERQDIAMDYMTQYREKLTNAAQAVKIIKSGDWVDYGWTSTVPILLDQALADRAEELTDVKIRGAILLHRPAIADVPNFSEHFTYHSWHCSGIERKMVEEGQGYYIPMRFSETVSYYRDFLTVDVAMLQVAPMDRQGWFNFGPSVAHLGALVEKAKKIIVEVNHNIPYCYGGFENAVHINQVDMIVEGENPPMEELAGPKELTETDFAVARQVVEMISDGACLQFGIGSMPLAIGKMIAESDLKDLGVHTEMYIDSFVDIAKVGKITGRRKPFDRGRQVFSIGAGTQKMYDYLDHNPDCMAVPIDYVNSIARIRQIDNFISVNGAVDIDLFGQVSSESTGIRHISGSGGQQDFVMGAYLSHGGKSFICISSSLTDKKTGKRISRIRPTLAEGSIATCTRTNLHYVVTEYGMVNVKGLSTWERAEALIGIAHPDFREKLIQEAERMHIWRKSNRKGA